VFTGENQGEPSLWIDQFIGFLVFHCSLITEEQRKLQVIFR